MKIIKPLTQTFPLMPLLQNIGDYFNIAKKTTFVQAQAKNLTNEPASVSNKVFPQYTALVLGIIVQPFLDFYIKNSAATNISVSSLLLRTAFGLVMGLAIFPGVYRRAWDGSNPVFVQLCSIFSAGLGWQTLFAAGTQLGSSAHT